MPSLITFLNHTRISSSQLQSILISLHDFIISKLVIFSQSKHLPNCTGQLTASHFTCCLAASYNRLILSESLDYIIFQCLPVKFLDMLLFLPCSLLTQFSTRFHSAGSRKKLRLAKENIMSSHIYGNNFYSAHCDRQSGAETK